MPYRVIFSPEAQAQLTEIYRYIAAAASPAIATSYTEAIVAACESFATFPHRGTPRDDVRPGLRITGFRKRVTIAFEVADEIVTILGVFYAGQEYEPALPTDE